MTDLRLVMPSYGKYQEAQQPLGLYFIKSYIESKGYGVEIDDLNRGPLRLGKEEVVGVYVNTSLYTEAIELIRTLKEKGKTVVCGGPHTFSDAHSLLDVGADYCCVGDGEYVMHSILDGLEKGQLPEERILHDPVQNLDELPIPDYEPYKNSNAVPISTSRGCPYNCIFCTKFLGQKWRAMSAGRVNEWLDMYDGKDILVVDDNYTLNKPRVLDVAEHIRKEKLALSFSFGNGIRINTIDREVLMTLRRMNTVNMAYGVESIHDDILHASMKGQTFEMIENAVNLTKKVGLPLHLFMIIGLPLDTYHKTLKCLEWVKGHGLKAYWNIALPYPNTNLYTWVENHGRWLMDPNDYGNYGGHFSGVRVLFDTVEYPKEDRLKALEICQSTMPGRKASWKKYAVMLGGRKVRDSIRSFKHGSGGRLDPLRKIIFGENEQDYILERAEEH